MAPTLVSSPFSHDTAPPTSPSLQMPNVFVIPPDEDDSPAWCCFDATQAPLITSPDIPFLDGVLSAFQAESQAPVFHRDVGPFASYNSVIMPSKGVETRSIMDVLMNDDYSESDDEMELDLDQDILASGRVPGNDSEVVEVIKVRRHTEDIEERAPVPTVSTKSSKSFKSRASKAFRSLRNVGKGSLRSKPKVQDIFTSGPATEREPPPRSRTPAVSRRGSAIFSQLFSPPPTLQSRSSVSSFDAVWASSESQSPPFAEKYASSLYDQSPSDARHGPLITSSSSLHLDHQDFRSPSPTPSTQTKSNRRRFSMMSLQRIFSFSQVDDFSEFTPSSMSRDSSGPSTSSSSGPNTPTEESTPIPPRFNPEDPGPFTKERNPTAAPALGRGEISFEMRLDSLHFESLSFDADRF